MRYGTYTLGVDTMQLDQAKYAARIENLEPATHRAMNLYVDRMFDD